MTDKALTIADIISNPKLMAIAEVITPYLPGLQRMGQEFIDDVLVSAVLGDWQTVDRKVFEKMTEDERDKLSMQVLQQAQEAVDREFARCSMAKEIAFKIVTTLLLSAI